ncbi:MAG TPA: hypothetical protein VE669_02990, partial [Actinomycetota bacterium]|nr:hypothetical protein [Actinomycetota bacterium]
ADGRVSVSGQGAGGGLCTANSISYGDHATSTHACLARVGGMLMDTHGSQEGGGIGASNDTYVLDPGTAALALGERERKYRTFFGQGAGWAGFTGSDSVGLLVDSGHGDSFRASAGASAPDRDTPPLRSIRLDTASSTAADAAALSWSHTVGEGPGRILVVGVSLRDNLREVVDVTYGGRSLTRAGSQAGPGTDGRADIWYLPSPPVGTDTVEVTLDGPGKAAAGATSFTGVDQTVPVGTFAGDAGEGSAPRVSVPSAEDDLIVDVVSTDGEHGGIVPGYGQAESWSAGTGTGAGDAFGAGSTRVAPGGGIAMSWNAGREVPWAIAALPLKPAAAFANAAGAAQGFGLAAYGMLVEGAATPSGGDTTYELSVDGDGMVTATDLWGQGAGLGGLGGPEWAVLADREGRDSYSAVIRRSADRRVRIGDPCTRVDPATGQGVPCTQAEASVTPITFTSLRVQGATFGSTEAFLLDGGSGDSYEAIADLSLDATLVDEMAAPTEPAALEAWGFYGVDVVAQGAEYGSAVGGSVPLGMLLDVGPGSDRYETRASSRLTATVQSGGPGEPDVLGISREPRMVAQGAGNTPSGLGVLLDEDSFATFDAVNEAVVETHPDPDGAFLLTDPYQRAHGANGVFAALGKDPHVRSAPSRRVCPPSDPGYRGFGTWYECRIWSDDPERMSDNATGSAGFGYVPEAPAGALPGLAFLPGTDQTGPLGGSSIGPAEPRANAVARLTDPSGAPIEGATLHFALEWGTPDGRVPDAGYEWIRWWRVDAVTDAD